VYKKAEPKSKQVKVNGFHLNDIKPRTINQKKTFDEYEKGKHLLLHGAAGSGKTLIALFLGLRDVINFHQYKSLVIVRTAVEAREIGFLPGTEEEKSESYQLPYRALCAELFGTEKAYGFLKTAGIIEFTMTTFLRGQTLNDSVVVIDEASNFEWRELFTCMTRLGNNTRVIICGDVAQSDFKFSNEKLGFSNFRKVIDKIESFSCVEFGIDDIVRGQLVKEFIIESYRQGLS
jgi:phosphate starvation-inducible protein PhoH and related proteins